jgi:hypothetical protein
VAISAAIWDLVRALAIILSVLFVDGYLLKSAY